MTESQFQKEIINYCKGRGAFVFNVCGGPFQVGGIPDLYIAHPVWTGWLEVKVKAKLESLQEAKINHLVKCDVPAFVIRWEHIITISHDKVYAKIPLKDWNKGELILEILRDATVKLFN